MSTFKDYTGLNICVRDIFQGSGDCAHESETLGYSDLNTLGFSTVQNPASVFEIKLKTGNIDSGDAVLVKYKEKAAPHTEHTRGFEFTTESSPSNLSYVAVSLTNLTLSNDTDKKTLAKRFADKVAFYFPMKYFKTELPSTSTTASVFFELCGKAPSTVLVNDKIDYTFTTGADGYYNDLPWCFSTSWETLNNLNLHRNGPFGFCSWKQVRNTDNRILQHHRKNNKITFEKDVRAKKVRNNKTGRTETIIPRRFTLVCRDEPSVVSKHHPLVYNVSKEHYQNNTPAMHKFSMKTSYNNEITFFSNNDTNRNHKVIPGKNENYEFIKELYLEGALSEDSSPLNEFEFMKTS